MTEPSVASPIELTGGCQCGAVRYRARAENDAAYFCHCRMCQKAFGNVFAAFINVKKGDVAWERGAPTYFASTKFARRGFCSACGTPLTFEYLDGAKIDLSVGSLDDPGRLRLAFHFGVESRIASFHTPDGLPEKRTDAVEHIVKRWNDAYGEGVEMGPRT